MGQDKRPRGAPSADSLGAGEALDATDRAIINCMQGGFPLCPEPYAQVASQLGMGESELLSRLQRLLDRRVLSRFGPLFQIERMGGAFCLAAMSVPEDRFEQVCAVVNHFMEVAHNYRRNHKFNMWFVLATETPEGIPGVIERIQGATGLPVFAFPKEREYFVNLQLRA